MLTLSWIPIGKTPGCGQSGKFSLSNETSFQLLLLCEVTELATVCTSVYGMPCTHTTLHQEKGTESSNHVAACEAAAAWDTFSPYHSAWLKSQSPGF